MSCSGHWQQGRGPKPYETCKSCPHRDQSETPLKEGNSCACPGLKHP